MNNSANSPVLVSLATEPGERAVLVKDSIDVRGVATRCGSRWYAEASPATEDAEVVARLRASGWQIAGKTKLHELAFGTTGINAYTGTPLNPHWPDLVPGGSSSGSAAAVAAGLAPMALGTDTGGSVRTPAACCGVYGLKPTFGAVSRRGVFPAISTLDCVGPLASDMDILIEAMQAIAPDFVQPGQLDKINVGLLDIDADAQIAASIEACLKNWLRESSTVTLKSVQAKHLDAAYQAGLSVINAETFAAHGGKLDSGLLGADVATRLRKASETTPQQVAAARATGRLFADELDALLQTCTVLALPTLPSLPPRLIDAADTSAAVAMTRLVRPFNLSGHPALSLLIEASASGPISLQLVAQRGADALLCAVAQQLVHTLQLKSSIQLFGKP